MADDQVVCIKWCVDELGDDEVVHHDERVECGDDEVEGGGGSVLGGGEGLGTQYMRQAGGIHLDLVVVYCNYQK